MESQQAFSRRLSRYYSRYTVGFIAFVVLLAYAERQGMSPRWIGYCFMAASIALYSAIGIMSRTADVAEYYVAGRRVPPLFNGMATAADWMSAASFIGMAGSLYLEGYQALAFVLGWTGGYCLVALLLAPYLRKFGQYTIPDFLGARYGHGARILGVVGAIAASFIYVVAQIYGVGLIASRVVGLEFEVGVFVGLAGVLVCSFLGGMRAVTWTQVAQYIIIIIAYLLPAAILSYKVTGVPVPQVMYGSVLQKLSEKEKEIFDAAPEIDARARYQQRAESLEARIQGLPASLAAERQRLLQRINDLRNSNAATRDIALAERSLRELPKDAAEAKIKWEAARVVAVTKGVKPQAHAAAYAGRDDKESASMRANFIALTIVLMIGTASLPHILVRYYTTAGVRETRRSVAWSLLFISLLYVTAPAYAVFAKWVVYNDVVGSTMSALPGWIASWGKLGLVRVEDINGDGILQLAELSLNTDVIVLATPEIAGLPYVVSGLVAAGGLAAALSTADGLLLTIANALSHDLYYRMIDPQASAQHRLVVSKGLLLVVAVIAAYTASMRPDNILFMVGLAFSLATSTFFAPLVLGIFWKRANRWGAVAGMSLGLATTIYYCVLTHPFFGGSMKAAWFDINPISAGIFGLAVNFIAMFVVSLVTGAPEEKMSAFVDYLRYPNIEGQSINGPSSRR